MIKNPFAELKKHEWILWISSMIVVITSNILSGSINIITLMATLMGVTALIFVACGNVWGQILTIGFSLLYAITSYQFKYYGEMITYLGMTMPIAILSVISWIKNPYEDGSSTVKIDKLSKTKKILMVILCISTTILFYFILKFFNTPNLIFSTISISTSFLASYLMFCRNSYYALAYALNDIVLIILWILATLQDISFLPMIFCFITFFINDIYGFCSWKIREKLQQSKYKTHNNP